MSSDVFQKVDMRVTVFKKTVFWRQSCSRSPTSVYLCMYVQLCMWNNIPVLALKHTSWAHVRLCGLWQLIIWVHTLLLLYYSVLYSIALLRSLKFHWVRTGWRTLQSWWCTVLLTVFLGSVSLKTWLIYQRQRLSF